MEDDKGSLVSYKNRYIKTYDDFINETKNIQATIDGKITKVIDLNRNYLDEVHISKILNSKCFDFTKLLVLNLSANCLTEIPKELEMCVCLERIILSNNKIKKIEHLDKLPYLTRIELRTNRITRLENLDIKTLKFLTLSTNLIKEIDHISNMPELEELGLFGNYLGDGNDNDKNIIILTDLLEQLSKNTPKLKNLFLGGNYYSRLENLPELIKKKLPFLKKLDGEIL